MSEPDAVSKTANSCTITIPKKLIHPKTQTVCFFRLIYQSVSVRIMTFSFQEIGEECGELFSRINADIQITLIIPFFWIRQMNEQDEKNKQKKTKKKQYKYDGEWQMYDLVAKMKYISRVSGKFREYFVNLQST